MRYIYTQCHNNNRVISYPLARVDQPYLLLPLVNSSHNKDMMNLDCFSVATPEVVMYADRFGLTALHWAISYDHSDHLKLLLKMYTIELVFFFLQIPSHIQCHACMVQV